VDKQIGNFKTLLYHIERIVAPISGVTIQLGENSNEVSPSGRKVVGDQQFLSGEA